MHTNMVSLFIMLTNQSNTSGKVHSARFTNGGYNYSYFTPNSHLGSKKRVENGFETNVFLKCCDVKVHVKPVNQRSVSSKSTSKPNFC